MTLLDSIVSFVTTYQLLFLSGAVGAVAFRMQHNMILSMFIKHLLVSIFVSSMVCLVVKNFTAWSADIIFVGGAIGGYFSSALIKEGSEIVDGISDIVKEKFGKTNNNSDNQDQNKEA